MRLGTFFGETRDEDYVDCRNTNMIRNWKMGGSQVTKTG